MYLDSLSTIYIKYILVIKNKKTVELTEITLQQQHQKLLRLEAVLFCYFNSSFTALKAFKTLTLSSCSTIYNALNRTKTVCLHKVKSLITTSKIIINKKIINKTFKALSRFYRSQKSHAAF